MVGFGSAAAPAHVHWQESIIGQRCAKSERNIKKVGYNPGVADDIKKGRQFSRRTGPYRCFSVFFSVFLQYRCK